MCLLILIGVSAQGEKRLLALSDGYRESKASWLSVIQDLQARGLKTPPQLAIGDGALGFWAALGEAWPQPAASAAGFTRRPMSSTRCRNPFRAMAKAGLHAIWMAETQVQAEKAFDRFARDFRAKYPKAVDILVKDRAVLL